MATTSGAAMASHSPKASSYACTAAPRGIKRVPRDVMHIIARFVPSSVPLLVRADRTLWSHYYDDPFVWVRAIVCAQDTVNGRMLLHQCATSLLANCPALSSVIPAPVRELVAAFDISADGTVLAYEFSKAISIANSLSNRVVATTRTTSPHILQLKISLSGSTLACRTAERYVFFRVFAIANPEGPPLCRIWLVDCARATTIGSLSAALPDYGETVTWIDMSFLPDEHLVTVDSLGHIAVNSVGLAVTRCKMWYSGSCASCLATSCAMLASGKLNVVFHWPNPRAMKKKAMAMVPCVSGRTKAKTWLFSGGIPSPLRLWCLTRLGQGWQRLATTAQSACGTRRTDSASPCLTCAQRQSFLSRSPSTACSPFLWPCQMKFLC